MTCLVAWFLAAGTVVLNAQTGRGTISGQVTDQSKGAVPGAKNGQVVVFPAIKVKAKKGA